jgi:hypothetical protein
MSAANSATSGGLPAHAARPFRRTIVLVETLVSLSGLAGSVQLLAGAATPPVSVLSPLGLSSWTLPAGWLFMTVAVPSGLALGWLGDAPSGQHRPFCWRAHYWRLSCFSRFRFLASACCKRFSAPWPSVWRRWDCWLEERAGGRAGAVRQRRRERQPKSSIPVRVSDHENRTSETHAPPNHVPMTPSRTDNRGLCRTFDPCPAYGEARRLATGGAAGDYATIFTAPDAMNGVLP